MFIYAIVLKLFKTAWHTPAFLRGHSEIFAVHLVFFFLTVAIIISDLFYKPFFFSYFSIIRAGKQIYYGALRKHFKYFIFLLRNELFEILHLLN